MVAVLHPIECFDCGRLLEPSLSFLSPVLKASSSLLLLVTAVVLNVMVVAVVVVLMMGTR